MGKIALLVGWLLGVVAVILAGFRPDPYLEHVRQIPPPHPYPTFTVLWILAFITAQTGLALTVLRPWSYWHSWGRAAIAFALSLGFLAIAILGAMHAPPPHAAYLLWLATFCVAMLGLFVWSIIGVARSSAGT